jgi:hypothetical protein
MLFAAALLAAVTASAADPAHFALKPEWQGPCHQSPVVDVNLGHSPEAFVRAATCQLTGKEPAADLVQSWAARIRSEKSLRRVDVVRSLAAAAGVQALKLSYSSPWVNDPELAPAPPHDHKRKIGAVTMFFFNCPGGVNCGMDWANNHAAGMAVPTSTLAWDKAPSNGFYDAKNPGFWRHELRDAKAAGLDFILPNVYGPDMKNEGKILTLAAALAGEADPVKVGLFDDPWAWGEKWFGPYWQVRPDLNDPDKAAALLYEAKWKPFFTQVPRKDWFLVDGRPMIYFYNAGKLNPLNRASLTLGRMKALFKKDFGVEPYVAVERAYFQDPNMARVADNEFLWDPLHFGDGGGDHLSRYTINGKTLVHSVARWDSMGRDKPGVIASSADNLIKGPEQLAVSLKQSRDADLLVFATWNDLGEGTGLNRSYDYYYLGQWLQPDYFMRMIAGEQALAQP